MGVELVIRLRQSPLCFQLEEAWSFRSGGTLDGTNVSFASRFSSDVSESRSRVALRSPGRALRSDFSRARMRGLAASARGSSLSNVFGGSDWNSKAPLDRSLPHGERDQTSERLAADGSPEYGLSLAQSLNKTKKPCGGTSGLSKTDLGSCQAGSLEEESLVRRDLSMSADSLMSFCTVEEVCGGSSGSNSGELPSFGGPAAGGVGIPFSLKMLKRRQGRRKLASGLAEVGNSLQEAFSSMVFMMKTLQSHTLYMRRQLCLEEAEGLLSMVQREMHASFVWLFQQIFSCTPELMILVMILLTDFTVHSVGNNPAFAPFSPPISSSLAMVSFFFNSAEAAAVPVSTSNDSFRAYLEKAFLSSPPLADGADLYADSGRSGNGGGRSYDAVAGGADGDSHFGGAAESSAMYSHEDIMPPEYSSMAASVASEAFENYQSEDPSSNGGLSVSSSSELDGNAQAQGGLQKPVHSDSAVLDQETVLNIVAPVSARLEDDDYSCYDRTDLAYQQAISSDTMNPLLLANYAQFLFLVRHDHDRAEELFRRAVMADPCNSDAIGWFASFLWLARHNLAAAEKAYRVAMSADPSNPFHTANYAHFLWHSGQ